MSRQAKNLVESLMPLMSMYAIIGHGIFRFPAHRQRFLFSAVYATILTILYLVVLRFTLLFIYDKPWYGNGERTVLFIVYVNVGIAVFGVFLSWCNSQRFAHIIENLTKVDETLQQLGATFDYARTRNEGYAQILFWIFTVLIFNWVDTLWFNHSMTTSEMYVVASILHHPVHVNSVIAFNFTVGVRILGERYRKANMILENLATPVQHVKINSWQNSGNKMTFGTSLPTSLHRTSQIFPAPNNRKYIIQIIRHVHLELRKVGKCLSKAYGVQMALEIAALFVIFTGSLYELYVLATHPSIFGRFPRIIVMVVWIGIYFVKLLMVNEACEKVCTEAQRTGVIIHRMQNNIGDTELLHEICQFSYQLLHDPLAFSPAGLITLGHRFVKRFMGTVTTYLMILIQMTPS